jgi:hypothetical protein
MRVGDRKNDPPRSGGGDSRRSLFVRGKLGISRSYSRISNGGTLSSAYLFFLAFRSFSRTHSFQYEKIFEIIKYLR